MLAKLSTWIPSMTFCIDQAFANASDRKVSPVFIMAHMIRASLFASATVTRRPGLLARSLTIHSASPPEHEPARYSNERAAKTSSLRM
jgi:hypothetical protein